MTSTSKQPKGRRLFSFAVVADTHVNESNHTSRSPFASNVMANDRARHVFNEISTMTPAPDFVVHLGDIVHPVPELPTFEVAAERFKEIVSRVPMPIHLVPGNHDIGEKNLEGVPAEIICEDYIAKYNRIFGRDYYSFEHGDIKCIIINAFLFNSGLPAEQLQKDWIDAEISGTEKRVFVFTHYPPYLYEPGERENYDTMDEPGRSWLLERLRKDNVEGVFTGHVHNFWYDVVGRSEMYLLPSTAFLRHDYTEFYRVYPGEENGRCDKEKLGYFVIDIYEQGHVAHLIRTHGENLAVDQAPPARRRVANVHTKTSPLGNFGVEMRHAWAEVTHIPNTGGLEEVGRKLARNDYQLMALWEMGLRTLKVPEQDIFDAGTVGRARLMSDVGHDFIVTSAAVPDEAFMQQIIDSQVRISAIELNLTLPRLLRCSAEIAALRKKSQTKIIFSKLRTSEESHFDGQHFSHFVNAGLRIDELPAIKGQLSSLAADKVIDGITVRLDLGVDIVKVAEQLNRFAEDLGCDIIASVKLAGKTLADRFEDDMVIARLAAEAIIASQTSERVRYVFDTFMDIDRGYFPRNGFIDRRFNPRPAGHVVSSLAGVFPTECLLSDMELTEDQGCRVVAFAAAGKTFSLIHGTAKDVASRLGAGTWRSGINLLTKEILNSNDEWQYPSDGMDQALVLVEAD